MKKRKSLILTSCLILLLASSSILIFNQENNKVDYTKQKTSQTTFSQSSHAKSSHIDATHNASNRSDFLSKPTEKTVTANMVSEGEKIVQKQHVSDHISSFNFTALAEGNFTSIAGTWRDANGFGFEFSPQGIVSSDKRLNMTALYYEENNEPNSDVWLNQGGGFRLHYYPAGIQIPIWHFAITKSDPSDFGRDRLIGTQVTRFDWDSTTQFVNRVFYKVSNDYTKEIETIAEASNTHESSQSETSTFTKEEVSSATISPFEEEKSSQTEALQ